LPVSTTEATQISTMVSVGAYAALAILSMSVNMSSFAILWILLSQIRNYNMIILIDTYIPIGVIEYILGLKVFSLSFDFLNIENTPMNKDIISWMDYYQPNAKLAKLELESGSSMVNSYNLYFVILAIIAANLV